MENDRYQPEKYDADEVGFYSRDFFKRKGLKARPLDFSEGRVVIDEPGIAATRAQWRIHNEMQNGQFTHFNTKDLTPYGGPQNFEHPLLPGTPVTMPKTVEYQESKTYSHITNPIINMPTPHRQSIISPNTGDTPKT
jgi:hypothetical protein